MKNKPTLLIVIGVLLMIVLGIGFSVFRSASEDAAYAAKDRTNDRGNEQKGSHDEKGESGDSHGHGGEESHEEGKIEISEEDAEKIGIKSALAGPGTLNMHVTLPGEVKLNADKVAHLIPRFVGAVKEVRKNVGDNVKKSEVLAVIESNESLSTYEIRSLVDGTIIRKHITLGEVVREDTETFVVADLATVWVDLNVYPKDLPFVRKGQSVIISGGPNMPEAAGTIFYVDPVLNEHTRTALARVVLVNKDRVWRPGLFVTAKVISEQMEVPVMISNDAIQKIDGNPSAFVFDGDAIQARQVKLGRTDGKMVEIVEGVSAGEKYVSSGSFVLKAQIGKSEASHEH